jgi:diguanylate cyclase (GGDEF)-like protein
MEVLNQQVMVCERGDMELAVLYLDLDGFKFINDEYGHAVGDELLQAASSRIKGAIRTADLAARWGGDEFVILLVQSDIKNAEIVAAKLVELISAPYQIHQLVAHVSASIGVAMYPSSADSASALLTRADEAMYRAKSSGKACYRIAT